MRLLALALLVAGAPIAGELCQLTCAATHGHLMTSAEASPAHSCHEDAGAPSGTARVLPVSHQCSHEDAWIDRAVLSVASLVAPSFVAVVVTAAVPPAPARSPSSWRARDAAPRHAGSRAPVPLRI